MNSREFKKMLMDLGATFKVGKGSHLKIYLNGKQSIMPMHATDLKKGTMAAIMKQLELK